MKCLFCCLLMGVLLFAGCARSAEPNPLPISSESASEPAQVPEEDARELFESYILPYETVAGGLPFASPDELPGEYAVCLAIHRLTLQNGTQPYQIENRMAETVWFEYPRAQVEAAAQSLFGQAELAPLERDALLASEGEFNAAEIQEGLFLSEDSALDGYTGSTFFSTVGSRPELRPPYEVRITAQETLADGGVSLTAARKTGDLDLPELIYTFSPAPDGSWRYRSVEARIDASFTAIRTPEQLASLSRMVNAGDRSYLGQTFRLEADLDLSGVAIEPIGSFVSDFLPEYRPFDAAFDGNGHTISNLSVSCPGTKQIQNSSPLPTGLFGQTGRRSSISNLNLRSVDVSGETSTGGLIGEFMGRLYNCSVQGRVSGSSSVGGLVGSVREDVVGQANEVVNCRTDVQVDGSEDIGGVFGTCYYAWVEGCAARGTVRLGIGEPGYVRNAGGFAGHQGSSVIYNCFASVLVQTADPNSRAVGGLVGLSEYASILDCYVNADAGDRFPVVAGSSGFFEADSLPAADYASRLAEQIPQGYRKRSEVAGLAFNRKLLLTGAVGFPEGDTLAVLIRSPDAKTLERCQSYEPITLPGTQQGGETALLLPVHADTVLQVSDYRFEGGEFFPNEPLLIRDYTGADERGWYDRENALLLEYALPKTKPGLLITAAYGEKTASFSYDRDREGNAPQIVYITAP